MVGRIECYIHSDNITKNKGACVVKVSTQTDFATKGDEFIEFCKECAKFTYAAQSEYWCDVVEIFPFLEDKRKTLIKELKEEIVIEQIKLFGFDTPIITREKSGII